MCLLSREFLSRHLLSREIERDEYNTSGKYIRVILYDSDLIPIMIPRDSLLRLH